MTAPLTKADFIRSVPELSPADVVARAKTRGIRLTLQNVYATRHAEKLRTAASATVTRFTLEERPAGDPERAFQRLALRIGITRAEKILASLDAAIDADEPKT